MAIPEHVASPERVELRKILAKSPPLPSLASGLLGSFDSSPGDIAKNAASVITALNAALDSDNVQALECCFYPSQAYWKDQFALTWYTRTFLSAPVVAANFVQLKKQRGVVDGLTLQGTPVVIPVSPTLQWIDCAVTLKTTSPAADALGRLMLLPDREEDGSTTWKIWIMSTWVESLGIQAEDETLLRAPARQLHNVDEINTDVIIIGGGNAGAILAARLKALAVESVILDRNANPGDNWALRYDSLKFHVPTSLCEMPYGFTYPKHLQTPGRLSKDDLATQLRLFISSLHLNLINSVKTITTTYNSTTHRYHVTFSTPDLPTRTISAPHLVLATGTSSQKPYTPTIPNANIYQGLTRHSASYKNPSSSFPGVKSVAIIGSANTAFDILEDFAAIASPPTITMVVRSPTYIVPESYAFDPRGFGFFDTLPLAVADINLNTNPLVLDARLAGGLFAMLASQEPERYKRLEEVGFPVRDSTHPEENVMFNLFERGGGHYVDIGGTKVLEEGKGKVKRGEPVGWSEKGLVFGDGTELEVEGVVWCTGFADKDVKGVVEEVLGTGKGGEGVLGPREIAERIDGTGGVDAEGEIRGLWKRHGRMENFWIMAGHTAQHRWWSKMVAMQIKAALEGVLPDAYRETKL